MKGWLWQNPEITDTFEHKKSFDAHIGKFRVIPGHISLKNHFIQYFLW